MTPTQPKKKILYVITKSNWGGAQRYVYDLATNFAKKYDVSVALGGTGELKTRLLDAGIRTIPLPFLSRDISLTDDMRTFKKLIELFKEEAPDIIHVNSSKIGGLGALAGRIAKVPKIIFTAHGWDFREERPALQIFAIKVLSWLTILFSHTVITVSERDEREALAMPFTRKKIKLIHNGISDLPLLEKEEARKRVLSHLAKERGLTVEESKNAFWFGTIAELHKNKGQTYAIEAFSKLPNDSKILFFIMGEGEERMALQKQIIDSGLENKIFLLGNVDEASSLLPAFDVFLFTSIKEGLPFAILEAGIAGIPTITSAVGGIPEIITDMQTGILVRPKNADEILSAIKYIMSHEDEAIKFGKKLQSMVKKDFSLPKTLKETATVYKVEQL